MQPTSTKGGLLLPKKFFAGNIETSPFYPLPARKRMMKYKPSLADDFIRKFETAEEITLREYIGLNNPDFTEINIAEELVINDLLRKNAVHITYRHHYQPAYRRLLLNEVISHTMVKNIRSQGYILQFQFEELLTEQTKQVLKTVNEFIEILFKESGTNAYLYLSEQLQINGISEMFGAFDYFLLRFKDLWSRCELINNKLEVEKIDKEVAIITVKSIIKRNSKAPKEEICTKLKLIKRKEWWTIFSIEGASIPIIFH